MDRQCLEKGYTAPVDVLLELGMLEIKDYQNWQRGEVDYLERVCHGNLHKLKDVLDEMRTYARTSGYEPSVFVYHQRGGKRRKGKRDLRFSKSGNETVERLYSTGYVDSERKEELRKQKKQAEGQHDI